MSSNMDLVRSIYEAWERGDFGSAEWAHAEIEYVIVDGPLPGSWKGLAGLAETWGNWAGAWEEVCIEADEYKELDLDRVLVFGHWGGRGKSSGLELDPRWAKVAHVFHVRDGKVCRVIAYFDRERALAELGLTPRRGSAR